MTAPGNSGRRCRVLIEQHGDHDFVDLLGLERHAELVVQGNGSTLVNSSPSSPASRRLGSGVHRSGRG